jgi:hypothetical protein
MDVLKTNWLREVDEIIGDDNEPLSDDTNNISLPPVQPQSQAPPVPASITAKVESKAPPTPTTPSTRSMAIDSIVDKMEPS